jgi:hypothetical protein
MRLTARTLGVATCLAFASAAPPAHAQADADRATARALGQDGESALASKDFKRAEDDFRRADSLVHAPTLMIGLARALAAQGKLVAAQEAYQRILRDGVPPAAPAVFAKALKEAKKEVQDVEPRLGGMTISVRATGGGDVAGVAVVLDADPVSSASLGVRRLVDPGAHVVRASAPGYKPAEIQVKVPEGGSVDAPLSLDKDAASPVPPADAAATPAPVSAAPPLAQGASPLPWVAFGLGAAGLGVGVVAGVLALGKHSDLAKSCTGGTCGPAQQGELDSYHSLALISTVGFIVAGVGAAGGVTLLLVQPKAESGPATGGLRITPVLGPGSVGAVGTF